MIRTRIRGHITPLITTHEPPSKRVSGFGASGAERQGVFSEFSEGFKSLIGFLGVSGFWDLGDSTF